MSGRPQAVLGSGVMGADIALSLALGGETVRLWGRREEGLDAARVRLRAGALFVAAEGLATEAEAGAALERVEPTTDRPRALDGVEIAIEAVAEQLELKRTLLAAVEAEAPRDAVLSSTTSSLSPTALAEPLARPERFVVAHYAQPAHLMMLVEVVPGKRTGEEAVEAVSALLRRTGKMPALCADIPGFVWSRLQQALLREFAYLVRRGDVTPETCDTVLKYGFAHRLPVMGTFEHADLAGLELMGEMAKQVWPDLSRDVDPDAGPIGELRRRGETGMRAGKGFYDWSRRDPDDFRRARDREIVRRLKLLRGGEVVVPESASGTAHQDT